MRCRHLKQGSVILQKGFKALSEVQAKRLQAEAARLECEMRKEVERRKRDLEITATEIEVHTLFQEEDYLKKHGHLDEAQGSLRNEVNELREQMADFRRLVEEIRDRMK